MSETQTCQCCGDSKKPTITDREKCLIKLAYQLAMRDAASVKKSIVSAKSEGITTEDIKEISLMVAEGSKESILAILGEKEDVKKNSCCV